MKGTGFSSTLLRDIVSAALAGVFAFVASVAILRAQDAPTAATAKAVGTIKAISGKNITLTPESGGEISVTVQDGARVVRVDPGSTDLKSAVPMQLQDLQSGDRILVRGTPADGGKSLMAVSVIAVERGPC